jgi:bacterioferritin (cytochrome b1)
MTKAVPKPASLPLSNLNYDLLTVLQNKLEALAAYEQYLNDCRAIGDEACQALIGELKRDDERHVQKLRDELERIVRDGRFR